MFFCFCFPKLADVVTRKAAEIVTKRHLIQLLSIGKTLHPTTNSLRLDPKRMSSIASEMSRKSVTFVKYCVHSFAVECCFVKLLYV